MNHLTAQDAREIFLQALPELSEPLKSAVEFTLANWHKLNREPRPSDIAINFFASLPALPTNDVDKVFAAKLNNMAKLLRDDPDVWLSLENLPHEQWRDVVGYEGLYKVSNFGRVKSFHNNRLPQLIRINPNKSGYATVALSKNGEMKSRGVHIIVAEAFAPNPRNLPVVHHADDTKINSCVWNLAWVTRSENTKLAYQSGAMKKRHGYKNFNARLTPEQVRYIRKNYKARDKKFGVKSLAIKFNVNVSTIADVIRLRTYKNIN
ncbi:MAG: HNH endonuclease [Selenomonadaceae bacterium]|nr:HNH endonuclease [Selenomonadaceae bacterium]